MELFFFWLFLVAHSVHGLRVLIYAEALERNKLSGHPAQTPISAATRYLFGGVLFLPGFLWAELAWLWLGLAGLTILAGSFALLLACSQAAPNHATAPESPAPLIAARARERRFGLILRLVLMLIWIDAWRAYL